MCVVYECVCKPEAFFFYPAPDWNEIERQDDAVSISLRVYFHFSWTFFVLGSVNFWLVGRYFLFLEITGSAQFWSAWYNHITYTQAQINTELLFTFAREEHIVFDVNYLPFFWCVCLKQ